MGGSSLVAERVPGSAHLLLGEVDALQPPPVDARGLELVALGIKVLVVNRDAGIAEMARNESPG